MKFELERVTVEDFGEWVVRSDIAKRLIELIDGRIYEKMPTELYGLIAARLTIRLGVFIEEHDLGRILLWSRHQMPHEKYDSLLPDIAFTSHKRALPVIEKGSVPHMPDLAIEIKLPITAYTHIREKANYYLKNGSKMVWVVFLENKFVEVYELGKPRRVFKLEDVLDGGEVLPAFSLAVKDVFAVENK